MDTDKRYLFLYCLTTDLDLADLFNEEVILTDLCVGNKIWYEETVEQWSEGLTTTASLKLWSRMMNWRKLLGMSSDVYASWSEGNT